MVIRIDQQADEIKDLKRHVDSLVKALSWYVTSMEKGAITPVQAYVRFKEIMRDWEEWRSEESFLLERIVRSYNRREPLYEEGLMELAEALLKSQGVKF